MKKNKEIKGVCPAMITPFDANDNLNVEIFRKHARMVLENGVNGLCVGGSTGEFEALTFEEVITLTKNAVEIAAEFDGYVVAGMGGRSTKESIRYAQAYEELGADVVLTLPPYYFGFTSDEVVDYYCDVANSTKLSIMVYNNPGKTNVTITPEMIVEMNKRCPNICLVKDSTADIRNISAVIKETEGRVTVFAGWDSILLESLLMGAKGIFSGPGGNCIPQELVKLYKAADEKNYDLAFEQWNKYSGPFQIHMEDNGRLAAWVKTAVRLTQYDVGEARAPYSPCTEDEIASIKASLKEIGFYNA